MEGITVGQLLSDRGKDLKLEIVAGNQGLEKKINTFDVNRPGLALSGYMGYFMHNRVQILGGAEITYLAALSPQERVEAINRIFHYDLPCVIITRSQEIPLEMREIAEKRAIAVLRTSLSTTPFIHQLTAYLDFVLAPQITIHGTLVDVYGVGLLYTGEAGIGKSECALDLVERGHRLVADDVVMIKRRGQGILIGYANEVLQHHIELRGVGIIDIATIFGIRGIRFRKRVEVEVRLKRWEENESYERTGLEEKTTTLLGVEIPVIIIPLVPGKNITVISEVIAMNHLLRISGYRTPEEFNKRLIELMYRRTEVSRYREDDLE